MTTTIEGDFRESPSSNSEILGLRVHRFTSSSATASPDWREKTPRACAVSAGEAKSVVMTALAIASSDINRISFSESQSRFWPRDSAEPCFRLLSLRAGSQLSCQRLGRRPLISGQAASEEKWGQQKPYFSKVVGEEWQI
jgi:hypothetical protein